MAVDLEQILTGKDGHLHVIVPGGGALFMAHVTTWSATLEIIDTDYQPAHEIGVGKVTTGLRTNLNLTETIIVDGEQFKAVMAHLRPHENGLLGNPRIPFFSFIGMLDPVFGSDGPGDRGEYVFNKMKPTGSFTIADVSSGAILERPWTFTSDRTPQYRQALTVGAP